MLWQTFLLDIFFATPAGGKIDKILPPDKFLWHIMALLHYTQVALHRGSGDIDICWKPMQIHSDILAPPATLSDY